MPNRGKKGRPGHATVKKSKVQKLVKKEVKKDIRKIAKPKKTWVGTGLRLAGQGLGHYFFGDAQGGRGVGKAISRAFGQGDYAIAGPGISMDNSGSSGLASVPSFGSKNGVVRYSNREYLGDILSGGTLLNGATVFDSRAINLNPGLTSLAPILSKIAQNFEEYEWKQLMFTFRSTSGNALTSTNTALGTVIMSTNYNANNPAFVNKIQQENYEFTVSGKPACDIVHAVECMRKLNPQDMLYVRNDTVGTNGTNDLRLSDLGKFQISTVGMQAANVNIGELWVSYTVELHKPKMALDSQSLTSVVVFTGCTDALPLGSGIGTRTANSPLIQYNQGLSTITISKLMAGRAIKLEMTAPGAVARTYGLTSTAPLTSTRVFLGNSTAGSVVMSGTLSTLNSTGINVYALCVVLGDNNGQDYVFTVSASGGGAVTNSLLVNITEMSAAVSV